MPTLQKYLQAADANKEKITPRHLDAINHKIRIQFIYTSCTLAGNPLTLPEICDLLEKQSFPKNKKQSDCQKAIGNSTAYDLILDQAKSTKLIFTEDIIKRIHNLIYQSIDDSVAGNYRTTNVEPSDLKYQHPQPEDLAHLMSHFIDQIMSSRFSLHPIELSAMAHRRFLDIHPFDNGNGQIARLLMNLILVQAGYPVICISPDQKEDYLGALSTSRRLDTIDPFAKLIAEYVLAAETEIVESPPQKQAADGVESPPQKQAADGVESPPQKQAADGVESPPQKQAADGMEYLHF